MCSSSLGAGTRLTRRCNASAPTSPPSRRTRPSLRTSTASPTLVDEYRLMVTPNLFSGGKRLFEPGFSHLDLLLMGSRALDTGAVILHYRRERATG
jgi:hypothetical protein